MKIRGFTIIELMIAVAIIAVLAAIAIPAYQNYTIRAKVSEAISFGSAAKTAVSEYYQAQGSFPTSNAQSGLATTMTGTNVSAVSVGASGVVTVTTSVSGATGTVVFTPTASSSGISWVCTGGTLSSEYRPAQCR